MYTFLNTMHHCILRTQNVDLCARKAYHNPESKVAGTLDPAPMLLLALLLLALLQPPEQQATASHRVHQSMPVAFTTRTIRW